ncbi:uncharacterized protein F4812DRAFT_82758 [Daldinia caldariorum]|uniref:uncharacterized protein n=1 Tax=Daldinia caldariorum TaxID=326644 RepID=UPI002007B611|nr:uncharacterized protein F4812DRAFT_82758 [Daldinia caldariorum]KAI1466539.1 hypothetical protein F4812DRAFT_82758 [Daldinia caldariorum]
MRLKRKSNNPRCWDDSYRVRTRNMLFFHMGAWVKGDVSMDSILFVYEPAHGNKQKGYVTDWQELASMIFVGKVHIPLHTGLFLFILFIGPTWLRSRDWISRILCDGDIIIIKLLFLHRYLVMYYLFRLFSLYQFPMSSTKTETETYLDLTKNNQPRRKMRLRSELSLYVGLVSFFSFSLFFMKGLFTYSDPGSMQPLGTKRAQASQRPFGVGIPGYSRQIIPYRHSGRSPAGLVVTRTHALPT